MRGIWGVCIAVLLAACGGSEALPENDASPELDPELREVPGDECNPLGDVHCALPFPSSVWMTDGHLALEAAALPANAEGSAPDAAELAHRDGFSAAAPILVAFPVEVDPTPLPAPDSLARSLAADSPTVLLDMTTGQRVPHFAELDAGGRADPSRQALIIRPAYRLAGGRRYAVAVTRTLHDVDGEPLPRPAAFEAILAGKPPAHRLLARVDYPAILAALAAAGLAADDLVVAWDFVTASDANIERDLVTARDRAFAALVPRVRITSDVVIADGTTWRQLTGEFDVPWFLGDDDRLARDETGAPRVVRTATAPLEIVIPECARTATGPVPLVIFGHGLFGEPNEVFTYHTARPAQFLCTIMVSTMWTGMAKPDMAGAARALGDIRLALVVGERLVQGVVSALVLAHLADGALADTPALAPLVDRSRVHFYGISLGGILGATVLALSPDLPRGVLSVPAANFSLIIERSSAWSFFDLINQGAYPDPIDQQMVLQHLQLAWDLTDPATYAPRLATRSFLVQIGDGDSVVNNLGAFFLARSAELAQIGPTEKPVFGTKDVVGPLDRGFTIYDEDVDPPLPAGNLPGTELRGTHETMRALHAVNEQILHYYETGEVLSFCRDSAGAPAACDCVRGHCGPHL